MDAKKSFITILWLLTVAVKSNQFDQLNESLNKTDNLVKYRSSEVLSRRKRFIVFPEGSSFQMVFCLTYPTIFEIGDIFLWGYTAALAYELPQDPYSPFRHHADPLHRRVDTKMIYFTDEYGKVLFKKNYHRKPMVNPAFAKRSADAHKFDAETFKLDRQQMHASNHKRECLKSEHADERSIEFHRSSRAALYTKIETMFQALGKNGKDCMLRTLCLVGQSQNNPQASFFEEILKAVFTLPNSQTKDEELEEYDSAHNAEGSCDVLYPDCDDSFIDPIATIS